MAIGDLGVIQSFSQIRNKKYSSGNFSKRRNAYVVNVSIFERNIVTRQQPSSSISVDACPDLPWWQAWWDVDGTGTIVEELIGLGWCLIVTDIP